MKKIVYLFATLFMVAIATESVKAQATSATDDATVTARIITPISLVNSQGLAFGNIATSSASGTVTLTTAGVRTEDGGVTPSAIGTYNNAIYTASGENNATYSISLPTAVSISNGSENMTVNNFTSDPSNTGTLSGSGTQTINVGATLNVSANQAVGSYTGTYNVTIAYN